MWACSVRELCRPGGDHLLLHRRRRVALAHLGMAPEHPLEPHVPVHPLSRWPGARSSRTICSGGSATTFKSCALIRALTHERSRATRQLSAARIPRRPRARSHDRRDALRRLSRGSGRRTSRRLSELVRRETCAEVALAWDLGPYLNLGAGEVQSGGRRNQASLRTSARPSSARCSLTAATGRESARRAAFGTLLSAPRRSLRDPKSALQEWAQGRGWPTPSYTVVERVGPDHAPQFRVIARVKGIESGLGVGTSKRAAEQEAARNLLLREGVWTEDENGLA